MGSWSSKTARNTRPLPASRTNRTTTRTVDLGRHRSPEGAEAKSEQIMSDAKDPDLDKMLKTIGQVSVPRSMTDIKKHEDMVSVLRRRAELDDPTASPSSTVSIGELVALLEARRAGIRIPPKTALPGDGNLDPGLVEVLARYVASPGVRPVRDPDPTKPPRQMAVWTSEHAPTDPQAGRPRNP